MPICVLIINMNDSPMTNEKGAWRNYRNELVLCLIVLLSAFCQLAIPSRDAGGFGISYLFVVAQNLIDYGVLNTKFAPVCNINPLNNSLIYFVYHPLYAPWLVAFLLKTFGVTALICRVLGVLMFQPGTLLLYLLVSRLWNGKTALWAAFFFAFFPVALHFGKYTFFEIAVINWFLLFALFYWMWVHDEKKIYLYGMLFSYFLACMTEWTGYLIAPIAVLHYRFVLRRQGRNIRLLPALGVVLFALYVLHVRILTGSLLGTQAQWPAQFLSPVAGVTAHAIADRFSPGRLLQWNFYARLVGYALTSFTFPALFAVVMVLVRSRREDIMEKGFYVVFPAIAIIIWGVVFPGVVYEHITEIMHFSVPMAVACALYIQRWTVKGKVLFLGMFMAFAILNWRDIYRDHSRFDPHIPVGHAIALLSKPDESVAMSEAFFWPFIEYHGRRKTLYDVYSWDKLNYLIAGKKVRFFVTSLDVFSLPLQKIYPSVALPSGYRLFDLFGKGWPAAQLAGFEEELLVRLNRETPTVDAYVNLSLKYYQRGEYQKAIDACRRALRLNPKSVEAYNNIGAAYGAMGMWDEEITACQQVLKIRPDYQLAINNIGWAKKQKELSLGGKEAQKGE